MIFLPSIGNTFAQPILLKALLRLFGTAPNGLKDALRVKLRLSWSLSSLKMPRKHGVVLMVKISCQRSFQVSGFLMGWKCFPRIKELLLDPSLWLRLEGQLKKVRPLKNIYKGEGIFMQFDKLVKLIGRLD